ncbi:MAG: FIST N-terminal domain-containing protein [Chitinophagaceae bacterium]
MRSIEKVVGSQVNIFGGMAADDITFTGTFVFTNDPVPIMELLHWYWMKIK